MGERSEHQDSAIVMSSLGRRHAHSLASSRHEFRRSGSEGATPSNTTRFLCFQMFQQHRKMNMELCFAGMVLGSPWSVACRRSAAGRRQRVAIATQQPGMRRRGGPPSRGGFYTARTLRRRRWISVQKQIVQLNIHRIHMEV